MLSTRAQWPTGSSETLYSVVGSRLFGSTAIDAIGTRGHGVAVGISVGGAVGTRYS